MAKEIFDTNHKHILQISVESGLNADGVDISIFQDGKVIHKKDYRYGYNASYSKSNESSKPYVGNIIQDYISKYNITEDNFNVIAGKNVFKGEKVSDKDVENFKTKYCNNLVFNDDAVLTKTNEK